MSHMPKVMSLATTVLLFAGGIAVAADPKQVPPTKQMTTPPAVAVQCLINCPDLVPWKGGGGGA